MVATESSIHNSVSSYPLLIKVNFKRAIAGMKVGYPIFLLPRK